jgi:hypothetical protein
MAQAEAVSNQSRALITGPSAKLSTNPIRAAHAKLIALLTAHPPRPILIDPDAADFQDRADHLYEVFSAVSVYLSLILDDTAQNTPGGLNLVHIEAVLSDVVTEVIGAIRHAVDSMAGRIA